MPKLVDYSAVAANKKPEHSKTKAKKKREEAARSAASVPSDKTFKKY
jgi:hypothetical protein